MKILHTSDWHIGKYLNTYDRFEEQKSVLAEIIKIADDEDVDAVVIAGDLFDSANPSTRSDTLLYKTLQKLANDGKRPVIAIAGNHDSPDKVQSPDVLARINGIYFVGLQSMKFESSDEGEIKVLRSEEGVLELKVAKYKYPLRVLYAPYANEARLKVYLDKQDEPEALRKLLKEQWKVKADKYCDSKGVNIFVSHLFFRKNEKDKLVQPDDARTIMVGSASSVFTSAIPDGIQYAALGHLHRFHEIDTNPCPSIYSGSPISYSFSEAEQDKFVSIITLEPGKKAKYEKKPLKSGKMLVRKKFDNISKAFDWLTKNQDVLVELKIVSDTYLTAEDSKSLYEVHKGIIFLIPEVKSENNETTSEIGDLIHDPKALFEKYFKARNSGQAPSEELLTVFDELLSSENTDKGGE